MNVSISAQGISRSQPLLALAVVLAALTLASCREAPTYTRLFDGTSLAGWECPDDVFQVRDGAIVGGSLEQPLKHSYYLCTEERYGDFELTLKAKFNGSNPLKNAGVSFRAERIPETRHVGGYQADLGFIEPRAITLFSDQIPADMENPYPLWGILVDEFRPNTSRYPGNGVAPVILLEIPDRGLIESVVIDDDWNELTILAIGPQITIRLNGTVVVDYTETEAWVPRDGFICLQAHSGGPYEINYKDIEIRPR
jgi:hypothetical protein